MVKLVYTIVIALFIIIPVGWVQLTLARWSAPLSVVVGFGLFVLSVYIGSPSLMAWGGGLFGWSILLFTASGALGRY